MSLSSTSSDSDVQRMYTHTLWTLFIALRVYICTGFVSALNKICWNVHIYISVFHEWKTFVEKKNVIVLVFFVFFNVGLRFYN